MEKRVEVCQDYLWKKIKKKRPGWKNKRTRNNKCQCIYGYGSEQCNRTTTFHFVLSFLRLSDLSSLACALKQLCTLFIVRKVFLEEKEAILKDFPSSLRVSTKFDAWNRGDETIRGEHDEEINKTYESTRKNATRDRALNGSRWFLDHFQRFSKLSMTFLFSLSLPLFSLSRDVFLSIYDQRPELRYEGNYSSRYLDRRFWRERERKREIFEKTTTSFVFILWRKRIVRLEAINPARSPANPAVTIRNVFLGETGSLLRTYSLQARYVRLRTSFVIILRYFIRAR